MKFVQVPVEVDEAVLSAALQAAMRVHTISIGGVTASTPLGVAPLADGPAIEEEEDEDEGEGEGEGEGDDEEGYDDGVGKAALLKRPASVSMKRPAAAPHPGPHALAGGWTVTTHIRGGASEKKGKEYHTYTSPEGNTFKSKTKAVAHGFTMD